MQRITICLLMLSFISNAAFGQVVAIQNDRQNIIYVGIDNNITIAVEQCPSDSIVVTCDHGEIVRRDENDHNHYIVNADSPGVVLIEVKKKTGKEYKLVDVKRYRAMYLPDPEVFYARRKGGAMSLAEMDESFIPVAKLMGFEHPPKYVIDSFNIMVIRDKKIVFIRTQPGGTQLDETTLTFFKTLQENDKILFTDMTCKGPDKRRFRLSPMEFVIKNTVISVNGAERK